MTTPAPWRPDRPVTSEPTAGPPLADGTSAATTTGPTTTGPTTGPEASPTPFLPAASPGPGPGAEGNWFTRGGWWFVVHLLSLGMLAPVPFVHAAVRTRRVLDAAVAVGYAIAAAATITIMAAAPHGPDGKTAAPWSTIGGLLILAVLVGGTVHLALLRRRVYRPAPRHSDPAIAAALAARDRREEARRLAATDPLLAREVRIGRPDLPRRYDDGGLVDLNTAPASVLAQVLGVDTAAAATIVAAREAAGRLTSVEDLFAYSDLPVDLWDVVRDRGIVLRP